MSYPVLSRAQAAAYVNGRRDGTVTGAPETILRGSEDDGYEESIQQTLKEVVDHWQVTDPANVPAGKKPGATGALSVLLYEGFQELPGSILSDRDFWRYCAAYLYELVQWRFGAECNLRNYGALTDSVRECLPHDMFQQAHIAYAGGEACGDPDPFSLAKLDRSDVWRSHILRVLIGNAPLVAHELLVDVEAGELNSDLVRKVAKNLQRARANLLFEVLDQAQARELVDRETARADS